MAVLPQNLRLRSSGLPAIGEALLLYRVDEIAREQVTALRTRAIVGDLIARKRQGLFVSLRSDVAKIGADAYKRYCTRLSPEYLVPGVLVEMIRSIRTSLDRFDSIESSALMYHAYMMTDAFLWCDSDTFAEQYRVSDDQVPSWNVRFTPDIVREWTAMLARSPRTCRIR
jgi:hypothetical protein